MIITPEDSRWLNSLANAYRTEIAQTSVSLQESQAKNLYNIIEGIQTALQVDLTEAQVEALISALSESQKTARVLKAAEKKDVNASELDSDHPDAIAAAKALKTAQARHDQDEMQRSPRIVTRAKQFASEDEQERNEIGKRFDMGHDMGEVTRRIATAEDRFELAGSSDFRARKKEEIKKQVAAERAKETALTAANPVKSLEKEAERAKGAVNIAKTLKGSRMSAGGADRDSTGSVRIPKKNRNRKI